MRILLLLLIVIFIGCNNSSSSNESEILKAHVYLVNIANNTNKEGNLPIQIDENTIAKKVKYDIPSKTITYSYVLLSVEIGQAELEEVFKDIEQEQVIRARENQGKDEAYRLLGVTINSVYLDTSDNILYSFKITPDQYIN